MYKRQVLIFDIVGLDSLVDGNHRPAKYGIAHIMRIGQNTVAVSYTHLDSFLSQLSVCFVVPQVNKITLRSVQNMASIRKRGSNSYLIVVSRGYDYEGNRLKSVQKTVKPPKEYTPKQAEKWVKEQAILFEREVCLLYTSQ